MKFTKFLEEVKQPRSQAKSLGNRYPLFHLFILSPFSLYCKHHTITSVICAKISNYAVFYHRYCIIVCKKLYLCSQNDKYTYCHYEDLTLSADHNLSDDDARSPS